MTINLDWKVHTPNLLKEVLANPSTGILSAPLKIFGDILFEVAERASEINDPELNLLMCRLALYEVADPNSKNYKPEVFDELQELIRNQKQPPEEDE